MSLWARSRANGSSPAQTEITALAPDVADHPYFAVAVAVAIVAAAALLRAAFLSQLATRAPFLTFYPAVALAALFGGFWPGVVATLVSAFFAHYFWILPGGSFAVSARLDQAILAGFVFSGLIVSWTAELSKRADRAGRQAEVDRREEVERLVVRRTAQAFDATEALHAEMSVRRGLEERFRQVVEAAPSAIIMIDSEGVIELVNVQTELVFGHSRDELLGRTIDMLLPERFRGAHLAHRDAYLAAPTQRAMGFGHDLYALRKDGVEFPVEIGLSPLKTADGVKVVSSIVDISKRKEMERALSESEERMRLMLDSIQDHAIVMLDIGGRIVSWNAGAQRLKGYEKEEILGKQFSLFHLPEDVAAGNPKRELLVAAAQGRFEEEGWRLRKDGSRYLANVVINAVRGPKGDLRGFVKVTRDITERKRIENELVEANRRFKLAAGAARLGFWQLDVPTLSLTWDAQMFDLYGLPAHEGPQPNVFWKERLHPEDRERTEASVRHAIAESRDFEIEYRIVRPDGGVRHLRSAATIERDADGRATRAFGVNFDFTERKQLETKLIEANERFVLAAEAAGLGVWDYDVEARTSRWDDHMFRLYGLERQEGEQPDALWMRSLHPDDRAVAEEALSEAIEGGLDYQTEFRIVRPDGGVRHLRASASIRRNSDGRATRMVGVNFDISERKQLETELLEANERFALAAKAAGLGFWAYDLAAQSARWDDQMYRLHDLEPESANRYAARLHHLHPDDRARIEQEIRDAFAGRKTFDSEYRIVLHDGRVRTMRSAASLKGNPASGDALLLGVSFDITERKRIETELLESNERFVVAAEAAGLGFWEYDVTAKSVRWDDQMFKIRGSAPVDGNHYAIRFSYVHADDKAMVDQNLREAAEGRKKFNCEYRIVLHDGRVLHMKSAASLQGDPGSADARLLGVSFDITERKEIENELIETNSRFALAAEAAELGFWEFDIEAQTLRWDDQMFRLYGVERRDGAQPYELWTGNLHPDDRARAVEEVQETAAGRRKFDTEFRVVWPDGGVRHLRAAATLIRDPKTGAARMFGVNFDITERKRNENKLIEANERFALAAEAAGLGFWDYDIETQTSYWDAQMYRLYGLAPEAAHDAAPRLRHVHADDRARVENELRDAVAGLRSFDSEYRVVHPSGRVRDLRSAASLKRDSVGNSARLLGVTFDITERKEGLEALEQARDAAEAASRAKSDFLAVMSHEIRTPMNGVMGMNALLLESKLTKRQRRMSETIRDSAESLLTIIDDVLDISKLESGKIDLEYVDFDLPHLIDKTVDLFAPRAEQKGLKLVADRTAFSRAALRGDEARLRQILLNLVANAIKFTPSGSVAISASTTDIDALQTRVRCEVRDSGPGVSAEAKERLFRPFEQADSSISRRFGGTGLGLSICKRLVELMGGRIGVTDRAGGGSIFWFELVLTHAATASAAPPPRPVETVAKAKKTYSGRILLAEDNAINIDVATMILEGAGYTVDVAVDGNEAISAVRRQRYDLVLMDVQMPRLDGLAATREIRASERRGVHLPIIAMTANAMKEDQRRCLDAGMDDYFSKPFQPTRLIEKVARWIEQFGAREAANEEAPPTAIETLPVLDAGAVEHLRVCFPPDRFDVLLGRFLADLEKDKEMFPRMAHASSLPDLRQVAHKLIASAGHFGARRVQQLATDLQSACEAGDEASVAALLDRFAPASDAATAALREKYPPPVLH